MRHLPGTRRGRATGGYRMKSVDRLCSSPCTISERNLPGTRHGRAVGGWCVSPPPAAALRAGRGAASPAQGRFAGR